MFWSLALEFQYYLVIGLLFPLLISSRPLVRSATVLGCAAASFVDGRGWFIGHHFALFLAGIVLCQMKTASLHRNELVIYPIGALLACIVNLGWIGAASAIFTCLMIAFVKGCPTILIALGEISYSLYLIHWPVGSRVMNLGARFAHTGLQFSVLLLLGVVFSIASALALYKWVELPAKKLAARVKYRSPKGVMPAASVRHCEIAR